MDFLSSKFIQDWKKQNRRLLRQLHPDVSSRKIDEFLNKQIEDNIVIHEGYLDNNYNKKRINVDSLSLLDWCVKKQPIIAGNGCLFQNQDLEENPAAGMQQRFLTLRKVYKKKMFSYPPESYEFGYFDKKQKREKVCVNS
jgi:hypothetical protein